MWADIFGSGRFPEMTEVVETPGFDVGLDELFEFTAAGRRGPADLCPHGLGLGACRGAGAAAGWYVNTMTPAPLILTSISISVVLLTYVPQGLVGVSLLH
jgi:hypothetical protein